MWEEIRNIPQSSLKKLRWAQVAGLSSCCFRIIQNLIKLPEPEVLLVKCPTERVMGQSACSGPTTLQLS